MSKYPDIAVDVVLFSYFKKRLNVLLIKRNIEPFVGQYALPGVFLRPDETSYDAALRALRDETNVKINYLEQLYTFDDINRDPRQRIISISYFGLINQFEHTLLTNKDARYVEWVECDFLNETQNNYSDSMAFDHETIYRLALSRLKTKVQYEPIGFDLLHQYFTLTELYDMYRTILQKDEKKFDRRNFTRKVMSYGLIKKTPNKTDGHVGRKSQLYEFDIEQYNKLRKSGIYFEI